MVHKDKPKQRHARDLQLTPVTFEPFSYQNDGAHIRGTFAPRLYLLGYLNGLGIDAAVTRPGMSLFVDDVPPESPFPNVDALLTDISDFYNLEIAGVGPGAMVNHARRLKDWHSDRVTYGGVTLWKD